MVRKPNWYPAQAPSSQHASAQACADAPARPRSSFLTTVASKPTAHPGTASACGYSGVSYGISTKALWLCTKCER